LAHAEEVQAADDLDAVDVTLGVDVVQDRRVAAEGGQASPGATATDGGADRDGDVAVVGGLDVQHVSTECEVAAGEEVRGDGDLGQLAADRSFDVSEE